MTTRKSATAATPAAVAAIPDSMTSDDYLSRIRAMLNAGREVARSQSWCSGWYTYLRTISHSFPRDQYNEPTDITVSDPGFPREWFNDDGWAAYESRGDRERGTEMKNIYGRVLTYVNAGHISLAQANSVFTAAGLPEYTVPAPAERNVIAYFPAVYVRAAGTARDIQNAMTERFRAYLAANEHEPPNNRSHPGTHSDNLAVEVHDSGPTTVVPNSDTVQVITRER